MFCPIIFWPDENQLINIYVGEKKRNTKKRVVDANVWHACVFACTKKNVFAVQESNVKQSMRRGDIQVTNEDLWNSRLDYRLPRTFNIQYLQILPATCHFEWVLVTHVKGASHDTVQLRHHLSVFAILRDLRMVGED